MTKRRTNKKDKRIGNKGWFLIATMLFWVGLSAIKIHEDAVTARLSHVPYRLADSWDGIKDISLFILVAWIVILVVGHVLNSLCGDSMTFGDD